MYSCQLLGANSPPDLHRGFVPEPVGDSHPQDPLRVQTPSPTREFWIRHCRSLSRFHTFNQYCHGATVDIMIKVITFTLK